MIALTADPGLVILERQPGRVTYFRESTGERWTVLGTCSCCGACEAGSVNPFLRWQGPIGTPNACVDTRHPNRLDVPVTPAFFGKHPTCTLTLEG